MTDLITLEEYKTYKKINNPERDAITQSVIKAVSDLIKAYCGRTFIDYYDTPKTEFFNISEGMNTVLLTETPIVNNIAVSSNNVDISGAISVDRELGAVFYTDGMFVSGPGSVAITYNGGFAETPGDIKLAAFELVDYYLQGEHTQRKTFGGTTVENYQTGNSWPFHIKAILDNYRYV